MFVIYELENYGRREVVTVFDLGLAHRIASEINRMTHNPILIEGSAGDEGI